VRPAPLGVLELIAGLLLIFSVLNDIFQGVVVPRPTGGGFRIARLLIRNTWLGWRQLSYLIRDGGRRERWLASFAPLILVLLLLIWIFVLIVGYGLIIDALSPELHPADKGLGTSIYFAGTSLLTIGFGDYVETGWPARAVALAAGATGLGVVALVISFLFSLYSTFQIREAQVVTLDARAGAPPSGLSLLVTYGKFGLRNDLPRLFLEWEQWAARVLDSHLAYPILSYFRSDHDNESWVSALGAVLDAATIVLTCVEDGADGAARMMYQMGNHLVEDVGNFFGFPKGQDVGVEPYEFEKARRALEHSGYRLKPPEQAWDEFSRLRASYADRLNMIAKFYVAPPAQWIGDRSFLELRTSRH
jgi:hypothetical protein